MHELGLTMEIVEAVQEAAKGARVKRVVVSVGKLAAVDADAMRFCFDACTAETLLEGAVLEIRSVPGRARCVACQAEVLLERAFGRCACGSSELDWISGDELELVGMEVA